MTRIAMAAVLLGTWTAPLWTPDYVCTPWDVKQFCCPTACQVSREQDGPTGDRVLRACMASLTCDGAGNATVFQNCECR